MSSRLWPQRRSTTRSSGSSGPSSTAPLFLSQLRGRSAHLRARRSWGHPGTQRTPARALARSSAWPRRRSTTGTWTPRAPWSQGRSSTGSSDTSRSLTPPASDSAYHAGSTLGTRRTPTRVPRRRRCEHSGGAAHVGEPTGKLVSRPVVALVLDRRRARRSFMSSRFDLKDVPLREALAFRPFVYQSRPGTARTAPAGQSRNTLPFTIITALPERQVLLGRPRAHAGPAVELERGSPRDQAQPWTRSPSAPAGDFKGVTAARGKAKLGRAPRL